MIAGLMRRLRTLFRRETLDRELEAEMRFHLEMEANKHLQEGMPLEAARQQALKDFGPVTRHLEETRDARGIRAIEELCQDLRYGCRTVLQSRGFATVVVVTLALGIGASTLVFSVVNAVLLRPLPYADPDRLVWMWAKSPITASGAISAADYLDYRAESRSVAGLAARFYTTLGMNLTGGSQPERVEAMMVSADFFDVLQVPPLLGRSFRREEEQVATPAAAILSHSLWQRLFDARPDVIGDTLRLDGQPVTIVGVMPAGFRFQHSPDLWIPIPLALSEVQARRWRGMYLVGRLRHGVTLTQAQEEMDLIAARLEQQHPDANAGYSLRLVPLEDVLLGDVRRPMLLLMTAVGLLLLIACANVANIILARGTTRRRELATRAALGAGRLRIVRLLIAENVVLALAGGTVGTLLAVWGVRVLSSLPIEGVPRLSEVSVDVPVLLFALTLSLATILLFGLVPASQAARLNPTDVLRAGTREVRQRDVMSRTLVVAELAITLVLLVATGLAARSLAQLIAVDPGFNPSRALAVPLTVSHWTEGRARRAFFMDLLDRVEGLPGIVAAGFISELPLTGQGNDVYFHVEGSPPASLSERATVDYRRVSPGYFRAMEIPLIKGRLFTTGELATSGRVAIVDERLVDMFFGDRDPLGQRLIVGDEGHAETFEIVGVVGSVLHRGLQGRARQTMYVPDVETLPSTTLVLRTTGTPADIANAVRATVSALDRDQPVSDLVALDTIVARGLSGSRFGTLLLGAFCGLGVLLAAVGLYGMLAFSTARRSREIAVRMALGSERRQVLRLVVGDGMRLALVGIIVGLAGAYAVSRLMESLLVGVEPMDRVTYAAAILLLAAVSCLASYLPARRAAALHPATVLRSE